MGYKKMIQTKYGVLNPFFHLLFDLVPLVLWQVQGVPKKMGISVRGSFWGVKWPQIKKVGENKPYLKFNFTY